ncbi:MAG: hypothetical protein J7M32_00895 [Deltaproteobacteria bacterium]|nr:hypothetical protein [Deltaproteobacteria bacterium]
MNETQNYALRLGIQSNKIFLPVAAGFAENAARALGLEHAESLVMRLAAEEVFIHLCKNLKSDNKVEMTCAWGGYFAKLSFLYHGRIPLRAFNLTATVSLDDEGSLDDMGLVLASRSVDRFEIGEDAGDRIRLSLVKEKTYPPGPEEPLPPLDSVDACSVHPPQAEELKVFARRVTGRYLPRLIPGFFSYPGKVVDMVLRGDFQALLAVDTGGQVAGGIMWHPGRTKFMEFFGPYRLTSDESTTIMHDLVEAFLMAVGKSDAVGVYCPLPAEPLAAFHFEELGSLDTFEEDGKRIPMPVFFRQIHEDPGATVWCHPDLEGFVSNVYERHYLPRSIRLVQGMGETFGDDSVFLTHMDSIRKMVVLKPMQFGTDLDQNLADHVKLFSRQDFKEVFFQLDLGVSWHSHLVPALLNNRFVPRLVVPYGGQSDLVIFQWDGSGYE